MSEISQSKLQSLMQRPETIRAKDIASVLDKYGNQIKVLSLDCFDTILWRKAATPKDVFYDMHKKATFKSLGFNGLLRIGAEEKVRQIMSLRGAMGEVKLQDIYREGFHKITEDQINKLVEEELEAEIESCYAFLPTLELMREANRRGIKIIIVSDTYLEEIQLRRLLASKLPEDILSSVYKIFCSCEYGRSKRNGIFANVIQNLKIPAESMLHIGDNLLADYVTPKMHNLNALHFIHQEECISDLMRLQDISAKMLDPSISTTQSMSLPFRHVLAMSSFSTNNPEKIIGYASLGPVMYSFARFICDEYEKLKKVNNKTKVLFLMRDAYLPSLACAEIAGHEIGKRVRISRFASYAASFLSVEDIESYLIEIGSTNRLHDVARQLLLPEKVSEPIIKVAMRSEMPMVEFAKQVRRDDIASIILKKSEEYRSRLVRHLNKEIGLETGSTLMLVDLGYSGTTQRRLTPAFKKMGIDIVGRYLISLRVPGGEANRYGLIDSSWCDDRAMQTIVMYIMLLEQLCTSNERSVIDYDEHGDPIYSNVIMSEHQHDKLEHIQSECLSFVRDAKNILQEANIVLSKEMLRQAALTELTRMIFLPIEAELQYLKTFQAEMNLGTQDILRVFDPEQGLIGLRRRGMFYMERPSKITRTNYPAELRTAGMELVLSLIAKNRFGFELKLKDMVLRKEFLKIVFRQGNEIYSTVTDAVATHDGYFALWLPTQLHTSIMLGENYKWIQIESAELIPMEAFVNQTEAQNTADAWPYMALEKMSNCGGNLFDLASQDSALMIKPISKSESNNFVFRLVFRPVVKRSEQVLTKDALASSG